MDLHSDANGVWQAWLWWGDRWNLLTAQKLPIGTSAYVEQYVEVHVDSSRPALVDVPTVTVDNVQLKPADGSPARYWRSDVGTLIGDMAAQRAGGFCLNWLNRYDTWTAGDCPVDSLVPASVASTAASTASLEALNRVAATRISATQRNQHRA
jgi:hypothetical protein